MTKMWYFPQVYVKIENISGAKILSGYTNIE